MKFVKILSVLLLFAMSSSVMAKKCSIEDSDQDSDQVLFTPALQGDWYELEVLNISGHDIEVTKDHFDHDGTSFGGGTETHKDGWVRGASVGTSISGLEYWTVTWYGQPDDLLVTYCSGETTIEGVRVNKGCVNAN